MPLLDLKDPSDWPNSPVVLPLVCIRIMITIITAKTIISIVNNWSKLHPLSYFFDSKIFDIISIEILGSACPLVSFITCPRRNFFDCSFPAIKSSTAFGLFSIILLILSSSSLLLDIIPKFCLEIISSAFAPVFWTSAPTWPKPRSSVPHPRSPCHPL